MPMKNCVDPKIKETAVFHGKCCMTNKIQKIDRQNTENPPFGK